MNDPTPMIPGIDFGPEHDGNREVFFVVKMKVFGKKHHIEEYRSDIEKKLSLTVLPCEVGILTPEGARQYVENRF